MEGFTRLSDDALISIANRFKSSLQDINLSYCQELSSESLLHLGLNCPNLVKLILKGCSLIHSPPIDPSISSLYPDSYNTSNILSNSGKRVQQQQQEDDINYLEPLIVNCSKLEILDFDSTRVDEEFISSLAPINNLQYNNLGSNNPGIPSYLKSIRKINLGSTRVDDKAIDTLSQVYKQLNHLNLSGTFDYLHIGF